MEKYVIELDREGCIGAASCTLASKIYKINNDDQKVDITDAQKNDDNTTQTIEINADELDQHVEAAQSCPMNVLHIRKKSGEQLI